MLSTSENDLSAARRAEILNDAIARYAREGWTISAVSEGQAIAQRRYSLGGESFWISSIFWFASLLLTFISAGLFLIVLGIMYLNRGTETVVIRVDSDGSIRTV